MSHPALVELSVKIVEHDSRSVTHCNVELRLKGNSLHDAIAPSEAAQVIWNLFRTARALLVQKLRKSNRHM